MQDDTKTDLPAICHTQGDQELIELAKQSGLSPNAAEAVAAIDAVMHKVRRSIQRRDFGRQVMAQIDPTLEVAHLDAISAIAHAPAYIEDAKVEVTVGLIAERLAVDPSRASRISAELVDRGYARRVASQQDARRICLELTPKGKRFIEAVRINKWNLFAQALGQWNERDLVAFAVLFERFSNWSTDDGGVATSAANIKRLFEESEAAASEVESAGVE
ncbi:MarR family transcriptional regulator [Devosia insulae DS-56]|uniref:MarR family transcriptional regulator n=1 Tax=Devosia insulae DS-56 TaxID=1116389 RepID=A0A1E5XIN2_9HYPH|nr:MarR family winged helix-turn-helix transcriptional regulator [Devosia insulae]OEO28447.1 MarR family transcriptional regulator [Devosia insulae DS-56]